MTVQEILLRVRHHKGALGLSVDQAEAAINAYIAERELETANAVRAVERARLAEVIGENTNPVRSEELHQDTYTKSELATLINGNINRIIAEQRKRAGLTD